MSVDPVAGRLSVGVDGDTAGFAASLRRKIDAETKGLRAKIKAEINTRGLKADLQRAVKEAQGLAVIKVRLEVDKRGFKAEVAAAVKEAQALSKVTVKVDADTALAAAKVKALGAEREKVKVKVDADTSVADAKIKRTKAEAKKTAIFGLTIDKRVSRELSQIGGFATKAAYGLALVEGAGSGIVQVVGILGDVVGGLFAIIANAGPAAGALALIPAALAGGGQLLGTALAGFKGIGKAVTALGKQQAGAGKAATSNAGAQQAAAQQIRAAEQAIVAAQRTEREGLAELTNARREAKNRLDDYVNSLKDAGLSEEQAKLDIAKALAHLRDVQADPRVSDLERSQADLDYRTAIQHLTDIRQSNKELQQEADIANKKGIEGADQVVAAKQKIAGAQQAQRNAERQILQAQKASTASTAAATGANTALAAALDGLSPAGLRLVNFIRTKVQPALRTIRFAAQEAVLPGAQQALANLLRLTKPVTKIVQETGAVISDLMVRASRLVSSKVWQKDIATIGGNNATAIHTLGLAAINLLDPLKDILVVLGDGPNSLVQRFANWTLGMTAAKKASIAARRENGQLAAFFDKTGDRIGQWGRILHNIGTALFNIGRLSSDAGQTLTDSFEGSTRDFVKWTREDAPQIKQFFDDQVAVTQSFGRVLVGVARVLGRVMDNPKTRELMSQIETRLGPALGRLVDALANSGSGAKLLDILSSLADAITSLVKSGALGNLLDALDTMATLFGKIAANPIGASAIGGLLTLAGIGGPLAFVAGKLGRIAGLVGRLGGGKAFGVLKTLLLGAPVAGAGGAAGAGAGAAGAGAAGVAGGGLLGRLGVIRPGTGGGHRVGGPVVPPVAAVGERSAALGAERAGSRGVLGRALGGAKTGAKGGAKAGALGIVGAIAGGVVGNVVDDKKGGARSAIGGAISGGATGAALGATVGSVVPILGTAIGAAVGGALGAIYGAISRTIGWAKVGSQVGKIATTVFTAALSFLEKIPGQVGAFFAAIPGAVGSALASAGTFVLKQFEDFIYFITTPFRNILGSITETPGFKRFATSISDARDRIAAAFGRLWAAVSGAATEGLDFLNNGVVGPGLAVLRGIWNFAIGVLLGIWRGFWNPLSAVVSAALGLLTTVLGPLFGPITAIFRGVVAVLRGIWGGLWAGIRLAAQIGIAIVRGVIGGFLGAITGTFRAIVGLIGRIWRGGWNGFFNTAATIVDNISSQIAGTLDGITAIFKATVAAIKLVWNGLRAVARAPVDFIVNTVYNNGIRSVWNRVAGLIKAPQLPELKFAKGGVVPGYAPGQDTRTARVSPGEGWLVPEAVRGLAAAMGTTAEGAINRINATYSSRSPGDGNAAEPHMFGGGVIGFVKGKFNAAKDLAAGAGRTVAGTAKAVAGALKGIALGALSSGASAAFKPMRALINNTLVGDSFPGLLRGAGNNVLDRIVSFLGGKDTAYAKVAAKGVGGNVGRWAPLVAQVLGLLRQPGSLVAWVLQLMNHESGGNPTAINLTDINAKRGDPSRGLMQTIGCVTLDTVILTQRGWLKHDEVRVGDQTIGYNPATGLSEWTPITAVVHYDDAEVWRIGNAHWKTDVTPNHRWWSDTRRVRTPEALTACPECGWTGRTDRGGANVAVTPRSISTHRGRAHGARDVPVTTFRGEFVRTDALGSDHRLRLAARAATPTSLDITPTEAALLAWALGDGHIGAAEGDITLYQSKPEGVAAITALLAGIPHGVSVRQRAEHYLPAHTWRLRRAYARELLDRSTLAALGPEMFVLRLDAEQRAAFLAAMIAAEGHTRDNFTRIAQINGPIQDAIKLAVYLEGYRPTFVGNSAEKNGYQPAGLVGMARPHVAPGMFDKPEVLDPQTVWCVTTGLGTWTAEQNGLAFLTGNSTFAAYAGPYVKRGIYDPLANIYAGLNYGVHRYGSVARIPGIAALMSGGIYRPYDSGGFLPPGLSQVVNATGKPEVVFTDQQWSLLHRIVSQNMGVEAGGQPSVGGRRAAFEHLHLTVPDRQTAATAIDMLDWAMRNQHNQGAYANV